MTYQQLLHFCVASYLCGLRGSGMKSLLSTRSGILGESGLMEKQIDSFYLFRYGEEDKSYPNNRHNGVEQPRDG